MQQLSGDSGRDIQYGRTTRSLCDGYEPDKPRRSFNPTLFEHMVQNSHRMRATMTINRHPEAFEQFAVPLLSNRSNASSSRCAGTPPKREPSIEFAARKGMLYNFLENPRYNMWAKAFQAVLFFVIFVSILCAILETTYLDKDHRNLLFLLEIFCTGFFSVELALRAACAFTEQSREYFFNWTTFIDILATVPGWFDLYLEWAESVTDGQELPNAGLTWTSALRIVRAFRILRLMRVAARSELLIVVFESFSCLRESAFIFLCILSLSSMLSATSIYLAERLQPGDVKPFIGEFPEEPYISSIPMAIWWSFTTLTTTGYGDIVPHSTLGRMVGTVTMLWGVLVNSTCVAIMSMAFTDEYLRKVEEKKMEWLLEEQALHQSEKPKLYAFNKEWRKYTSDLDKYVEKLERTFTHADRSNEKDWNGFMVEQVRQTTKTLNSQVQFVLDHMDISSENVALRESTQEAALGSTAKVPRADRAKPVHWGKVHSESIASSSDGTVPEVSATLSLHHRPADVPKLALSRKKTDPACVESPWIYTPASLQVSDRGSTPEYSVRRPESAGSMGKSVESDPQY